MSGLKVPFAKPVFDEDVRRAAVGALENERFVLGESVFKFEEEFAKYCGVECAVSTSSGTSALQFSLMALGVKSGAEVVTTPASFIGTANSILHAGGTPVFTDSDLRTYTLNPDLLEQIAALLRI